MPKKSRDEMFEKALTCLRILYANAKEDKHIYDPLGYALYRTWEEFRKEARSKARMDEKEEKGS